MLSAVSHTVVRRPSGATAGLITVEFNYELSYITTESLISIHPLAPLTRWYHAVCAQSAYRVHTAIVLSGSEDSRPIPTWDKPELGVLHTGGYLRPAAMQHALEHTLHRVWRMGGRQACARYYTMVYMHAASYATLLTGAHRTTQLPHACGSGGQTK